jgi:hypothetical protein
MNVRFPTAMVMVTVSMGSVHVSVDTWASSVRKVSGICLIYLYF